MMQQPDVRTGYAERRRRSIFKGSLRVKMKSQSRHVA